MTTHPATQSFVSMIDQIEAFWSKLGCCVIQPVDLNVGAATFHPETFLRAIGPQHWSAVYTQLCRRPTDGRYGMNQNRLHRYHQLQVVMKPSPDNFKAAYIESLAALGFDLKVHDIRFVEDNWESPTLGASGIGWEVWLDGMEVTQFTYFQHIGGLPCSPIMGEITYGLERIALYLQKKDSVYDLVLQQDTQGQPILYGDVFQRYEFEMSRYVFEHTNPDKLFKRFNEVEGIAQYLIEQALIFPAYETVLKASHTLNLIEARQLISATERQAYILRVRDLAQAVARLQLEYSTQDSTASLSNSTMTQGS